MTARGFGGGSSAAAGDLSMLPPMIFVAHEITTNPLVDHIWRNMIDKPACCSWTIHKSFGSGIIGGAVSSGYPGDPPGNGRASRVVTNRRPPPLFPPPHYPHPPLGKNAFPGKSVSAFKRESRSNIRKSRNPFSLKPLLREPRNIPALLHFKSNPVDSSVIPMDEPLFF